MTDGNAERQEHDCGDGIPFARARQVKEGKRIWLIKPVLSSKSLCILTGPGGVGKSTLIASLVAHVTGGRSLRGADSKEKKGAVAMFVGEESIPISVRPRLDCAGANMRKVFFPGFRSDGQIGKPVTLPGDLLALRRLFVEHSIRLAVVDPLVSFCHGVDLMSQQGARLLMTHLHATSEACNTTWLLVVHPTKLKSGSLMNRISLSASIPQQARSVLWLASHPINPDRRTMLHIKSNEHKRSEPLDFSMIVSPNDHLPPKMVYVGVSDVTEDQLDNVTEDGVEADAHKDARELLRRLIGTEWRPCMEVLAEARNAGIGERTIRSAKVALGVQSRRATNELTGVCWEWGPPLKGWPS